MADTRWEQIQTIFHDAASRPESERQAFLESACGDDQHLKDEVAAMLKADGGQSILDHNLSDVAYRMLGVPHQSPPFLELGPYRLKNLLGEGGMGVVWLAERKDTRNLVAIKFLPHAALSRPRRERFAHEIRTLAKLKHPFIARLYDAGTLGDGTPWFVMEYVEGVNLTEYCGKELLPITDRLGLFRQVCEAVQYAHGQEIIHRDLKPSNIIVEQDGTPKLLDFGIARELRALDEPGEQTRAGVRFLSPDYAAPEWKRDGTVGFYTDVYSLGVIVYEMLTGHLPVRTPCGPDGDRAHAQVEKPSVAVSSTTEQSRIGKAAWKDLDVLCLKAMHADARERYPSVEALIRDIDHYLKGEPLEARPATWRYRTVKFANRNRGAVLAASLVFALIVGLVVFFTLRLARARDAALAEAARTQRVEQFMNDLFNGDDVEAGPADDLRVVTVLDRGVKNAQALHRDPEIQAELYQSLGGAYLTLGKYDRADKLLHSALGLRMSVFGPDHQKVAQSLVDLGALRLEQGQPAEAERMIREGLAMAERHAPIEDPAVVHAKTALGLVLETRGAHGKAMDVLNDVARTKLRDKGNIDQAASMTLLANAYFQLGDYTTSESLNLKGLKLDQQLHGEHHPNVATDYINLGHIQSKRGQYGQAEQYYLQALAINLSWYGKDHPITADAMTYVAQALVYEGRNDSAKALLDQALPVLEHAYPNGGPRVAVALGQLGTIVLQLGKLDEAEADFRRMVQIYKAAYGEEHQNTTIALGNLASVYLERKQYARAEALFRDVVDRDTRLLPAGHLNTANARIQLGRTLLRMKRYAEAEAEILAGYDILTKMNSPTVRGLQQAREDLAKVYEALNQPEKVAKFRSELVAYALTKGR